MMVAHDPAVSNIEGVQERRTVNKQQSVANVWTGKHENLGERTEQTAHLAWGEKMPCQGKDSPDTQ